MQVYTIGYTGRKPKEIKDLAAKLNAVVVDVRLSPYSRVKHWNSKELEELLGSKYVWVGELGNLNYRGDGPIKIKNFAAGEKRLNDILASNAVILLCACAESEHCHRRVVAEKYCKLHGLSSPIHIGEDEAEQINLL